MHLALTPEQEALRSEIRRYFADLMTPEVVDDYHTTEGGGPLSRAAVRRMGADGWLGTGWPEEYGGKGFGAVEQYLFMEESWRAQAPVPMLTLNTVGPTIMAFGSDEQKQEFLPKILAGEIHFAIGYSEPGTGTDLAGLTTRAVRDGDEYVINGQKMWTSLSHFADYIWLACRTDTDVPKHKGLSIIIVPTDSPGFKVTPVNTIGGHRTNASYYEDVRVPVTNCVGGENNGWKLITNQLNHERFGLAPVGSRLLLLDDVVRWATERRLDDGSVVIDQPWVRTSLGRIKAELMAHQLMNFRMADDILHDRLNPADASTVKVFGSERAIEHYRLMFEIIGQVGYIQEGSPDAVLRGRIEQSYRGTLIITFGGGANEIQRDIIAMVGLGMPRAPR